jgi:hypothetical protein
MHEVFGAIRISIRRRTRSGTTHIRAKRIITEAMDARCLVVVPRRAAAEPPAHGSPLSP